MFHLSSSSMLAIMFLLHLFSDFTLQIQSGMDKFKQRRWWRGQILEEDEVSWEKYKNDYKVGLLCHSAYWSLLVCLPLVMCGGNVYLINAAIHCAIHYVIDDLKANMLRINLVKDQFCHAVQILSVWAVWMLFN